MQEFADQAAKWVSANPWGILLIAVITLVSFPLAIWGLVIGIRSHRVRRPCYLVRSNNLVSGLGAKHPELDIHWKGHGESIPNLTVCKLVFWNRGRETINKGDVAKLDPLVVKIKPEFVILDAKLLQSEVVNAVEVQRAADKKSISVRFEHFDKAQGFVLQIIHTGTSADDVQLAGSIKGAGQVERVQLEPGWLTQRMVAWFLLFGYSAIVVSHYRSIPPELGWAVNAVMIAIGIYGLCVRHTEFLRLPPAKLGRGSGTESS